MLFTPRAFRCEKAAEQLPAARLCRRGQHTTKTLLRHTLQILEPFRLDPIMRFGLLRQLAFRELVFPLNEDSVQPKGIAPAYLDSDLRHARVTTWELTSKLGECRSHRYVAGILIAPLCGCKQASSASPLRNRRPL